jgi:pSer/pThr/pTyr-binding forkhead associated (FHA) protein
MNVRFVVPSAKDSERSYERKLPIVVGRSDEAKFRVKFDSVSRKHCEIFEKDGGVFVRDLGSTNGTLLDGEMITVAVPSRVRPGGTIQVGGFAIRIEYEPVTTGGDDDETASVRVKRRSPAQPAGRDTAQPAGRDTAQPAGRDTAQPAGRDTAQPAAENTSQPAVTDTATPSTEGTPQEAGFSFLEAAASPEAAPDDEHLGDFFKSLE